MRLKTFLTILTLIIATSSQSQNFSGLLNKRLNRVDDVSSMLESGLGSLFGGKLSGQIDSVVVTHDAEKKLKGKIYYTGYANGYFAVSCVSSAKQKQSELKPYKFSQVSKTSPVEFTIDMDAAVPPNTGIESPYLRIDVAKRENGGGNITVLLLNKKWQSTQETRNMIIEVRLTAVGKAASLTNERKDVTPTKVIKFDPKVLYIKPNTVQQPVRRLPAGGGNYFKQPYRYSEIMAADITGTWISDNATSGITKIIITGTNQIQAFGRCSPQDCDWGKVALITTGASAYRALFSWSFKKSNLNLIVGTNGVLTVNGTDTYNDGRATRNYSYTFKKNIQLVAMAPQVYTLKQVGVMTPATTGTVNKTAKGPDKNVQIYLLDGLSADVDFRRPQDISNININVFADKNLNSGIYYILPADYHLKWEAKAEPEKGYDFRILYGAQRDAPAAGEETSPDAPVRMSASLTAGISTRERNFVKELLKAVRPDFVDLRYLPLRESPQFTFQSSLGAQYNIPESKITVERITDLSGDIKVAWQTDADTKEFIQTALTSREGISASVILKPDDEEILDQQIPASINLADIRTLGKMNLEPNAWRTEKWRNQTPYPLKLKYIHVLKKEISGTKPIIYSWSLNDVIIPPQAQAYFDNTRIPTWLDIDASAVMWIEYMVEDCLTCDQKVLDAVTGGVSGARSQQVKFVIPPTVFDSLKASYFLITVRSKQADPKGIEMKEFDAIRVTTDLAREFTVGPLFIPSSGTIEFEYKVTVATTEGDFYPSNQWVPATEKDVLLGKTKLKAMFRGIIPGIE
ncbi:MAG: hypothetical protein ABIR18_11280 [Chitinophagaceae bacterium]